VGFGGSPEKKLDTPGGTQWLAGKGVFTQGKQIPGGGGVGGKENYKTRRKKKAHSTNGKGGFTEKKDKPSRKGQVKKVGEEKVFFEENEGEARGRTPLGRSLKRRERGSSQCVDAKTGGPLGADRKKKRVERKKRRTGDIRGGDEKPGGQKAGL